MKLRSAPRLRHLYYIIIYTKLCDDCGVGGGGEVSQLCLNSPRLKDNNYTVFGRENNEFCNFAYTVLVQIVYNNSCR